LEIIKAAKETLNIDKSPDSKRERAIFWGRGHVPVVKMVTMQM